MKIIAKPFIKWVGGKGQLINQIESKLPSNFDKWENVTYIEPFVGGGAVLFHMLQQHPNIKHAVINDINSDLIICYRAIRDNVKELITALNDIQSQYYSLSDTSAKLEMYMTVRKRYNKKCLEPIEIAAYFIFLNRTCFNGLYRVNKSGLFNVPWGKHIKPLICDEYTLRADSQLLKRVEILEGDFEQTMRSAIGRAFFYLDPPYRPLSETSNFKDYSKEVFNDDSQIRLKDFCDRIVAGGNDFLLSNSDPKNINESDNFFDELYSAYYIDRVMAARNVNANGQKRGKISELLIRSYSDAQDMLLENKRSSIIECNNKQKTYVQRF